MTEMVELKEITRHNYEDVLRLHVAEHQQTFVSSTAHSLAQAYVYRDTAFPFAIYADDTLVGFIMFGYYEAREQYTLWKFLIDERYQNQGYGREALRLGIAYVKERFDAREIYTGVVPQNSIAKHLYDSVGFRATGIVEDNMEEMRLICEPH